MLPAFLIQALYALGGVFFVLCITVFHYFKGRVDEYTNEKMRILFSSQGVEDILKLIRKGSLPLPVMKDFNESLFQIANPRRRLRNLLVTLPFVASLFILSASLASVAGMGGDMIAPVSSSLEFLADSALLVGFIIMIYCAFQLVRLGLSLT